MLSAAERNAFEERGVVRLEGAVPPAVVDALRGRTLLHVAERGLVPPSPPPGFAIKPSLLGRVTKGEAFAALWGARVVAALDALLGAGAWTMPACAGQLLFMSYPVSGEQWQLPHKTWHLDYPAPGALRGLPGAQLFLCVDRIEPRSGATLVAAGIPRLVDAIRRREGSAWPGRSSKVRKALVTEVAWFRALSSQRAGEDRVARFMREATPHDGVALQVIELTGEAGDVYVMHPWMLHNLSPNCGARPRMALTERVHVATPR